MSRLGYEVGVDGVPSAVNSLRQVGQATAAVGQSAASANVGFQAMASGGQQLAQRVQGASSAVAALASRLGAPGIASGASLIASVAGSTAQFAAMGSMLGPGGTVVGAIVGLAAGVIPQLIEAYGSAEEAQDDLTESTQASTVAFQRQAVAADEARLSSEAFNRSLSRGGMEEDLAIINDAITQLNNELVGVTDIYERMRIERRIGVLSTHSETFQRQIALNTAPPTRPSGGGRSEDDEPAERDFVAEAMDADAMGRDFFAPEAAAADAARVAARLAEQEQIAKTIELEEQAAEAAREHADAMAALQLTAEDAALAFSNGYVNSLDQVAAAYANANQAARAAGTGMISQGRLLERSMVAVGNSIAESVGGTMVSAFEKAVGAWLDGSLSLVDAAEQMAHGVIRALVTESIVQTVVEAARAIASAASYDFSGAAMHAGAAAAWAVVGGVAGAAGAAAGSFGGGGGGGAGPGAIPQSADAERNRDNAGGGDTYNITVNPGGFVTTRDVEDGLVAGLDRADRRGVRPSSMRR